MFAEAFGHTYGHSAIMQMFMPKQARGAYGNSRSWPESVDAPGAGQMQHLKKRSLSKSCFDRVPDQTLIAGNNGERYERVLAARGKNYALPYTDTGKRFELPMEVLSARRVRAAWYDPRTGDSSSVSIFAKSGTQRFSPPGYQVPATTGSSSWVVRSMKERLTHGQSILGVPQWVRYARFTYRLASSSAMTDSVPASNRRFLPVRAMIFARWQ